MKNTLAENLLRFGVKNLSEAEKKTLQEQEAYTVFPMTISLPYKKDANGQMAFDQNGYVKVFAKNEKGTESSSMEPYSAILTIEFARTHFVNVKSKKDAAGNIVGTFSVYNQKPLITYLKSMIGKTLSAGDKSVSVTVGKVPAGTTSLYAPNSVFNTYDTGATPTKLPTTPPSKN